MKTKLLSISIVVSSNILFSAHCTSVRDLEQEFIRIGIYNPESPALYNEARAAELLKKLGTKDYRALASRLRRQQLESLNKQTPSTSNPDLIKLQEENRQLREHARHIQEENGRLRRASAPKTTEEEIKQLTDALAEQAAQHTQTKERINRIVTIATDLITDINDLTLEITRAQERLNSNDPVGAQHALDAAITRIGTIIPQRNNLEEAALQA